MDARHTSTEAQRRTELGLLTQALRRHLTWQSELCAEGAPYATDEAMEALDARIANAQRRKDEAAKRALLEEDEQRAQQQRRRSAPKPTPAAPTTPSAQNSTAPASPEEEPVTGIYKATRLLGSSNELEAMTRGVRRNHTSSTTALDTVREALGECTRCSLSRSRTKIVFGEGNPNAELIFVGEAPGFHEDRHGKPFVGRTGQMLSRMIAAMGYKRDEIYLCNVLKCRPPGGRAPGPSEIGTCKPFLIKQLQAISPKIIVALGDTAAQSLLRDPTPIEQMRGQWFKRQGIRIMPTYHPSRLMRDAQDKRLVWGDLQKVMAALGRL